MRDRYDLIVIGSGIAGSTLALALSRIGCNTLVVERGSHPRFAIGESTIPSTTYGFRYLARKYGIPELERVIHYTGLREAGLTGYPKRHFWFGWHHPHQELAAEQQMAFETFPLPRGPDVHMLRADVDAYLASTFPDYGVDYSDRTTLTDFEHGPNGVRTLLATPNGEREVRARLVVDAGGHGSFLAQRFGLREDPPNLATDSRSIFGHVQRTRALDRVLGENPFRHNREAGTVHHCFDGGWVWVIPFDKDLVSVGFMLHPERFPYSENLSAEAEIDEILSRFPTIGAHLGSMIPVRPWIRTGRVQFRTKAIAGDGFVLTPHAAAFVEPLFSTGLLLTQGFILRLLPLVGLALKDGDFSKQRFEVLQKPFFRELAMIDLVVSGMVASFRDFEVFKQYWRVWIHATSLQYLGLIAGNPEDFSGCALAYGAAFSDWEKTLRAMHALVGRADLPHTEVAMGLKAIMDRTPHPFRISRYGLRAGTAFQLHPDMDLARQFFWGLGMLFRSELRGEPGRVGRFLRYAAGDVGQRIAFAARYLRSKTIGGSECRHIDALRAISKKTRGATGLANIPKSEHLAQ